MPVDRIWAQLPDGSGRVENLAGIVRARAAATPDGAAVVEPHRSTTFAELDARSSQVAQALLADGVRAGDRVAYIGVNAPSFLEVLYGSGHIRLGADGKPARVGGVDYTIKDGIVFDAKKLLAEVRAMVTAEKSKRGITQYKQPGE